MIVTMRSKDWNGKNESSTRQSILNKKIILYRQPCPHCQSSDAYHVYADGHGHCFSCTVTDKQAPLEYFKNLPEVRTLPIINEMTAIDPTSYSYQYIPLRAITKETMVAYNVQTKVDNEGKPLEIAFPYSSDALKIRKIDEKIFYSKGDMKSATLFGKDKFSKGSARSITITEGEFDALSVYQMLGSAYPAVSVRSASSATADCKHEWEYLNSFEKIYLCFDNDEPGKKAKASVARLFDFNKIYDVDLSQYKDANAYLEAGETDVFRRIWWNAKRFLPEGILSSFSEFDSIIDTEKKKDAVAYPFPTVQEMTYGIRTGEVVLITAMEGIGKTEVIRAIEYHLLKITEDNIGVIHLEEDKERLLKGLAGYELKQPAHLPDVPVSREEIKEALHKTIRIDNRLHIYNHFGSDDPDVILDIIRFLVASCNCRYVFFDHITMAVSGLGDEDERKALDYISTRLAMMVKELDFALILVSHVNDEGKTRGSRNISKIADCWIHLDRDQQASTEEQRNTTYLTFRKNRFGARTGPGGKLLFDISTFMIEEADPQKMSLPPVNP